MPRHPLTAGRLTISSLALTALISLFAHADSHKQSEEKNTPEAQPTPSALATFAGGCFWCLEADYDKVSGVLKTTSGFAGGTVKDPSYQEVAAGKTRHIEAVQIEYNPAEVSYQQLLEVFWKNVDPTDAGGQFCDRGPHYRTAIFPHGDEQLTAATAAKQNLINSAVLDAPIVTDIIADATFYPAEAYHQDYHTKNPIRYKIYRYRCGRDQRLEELWGKKPSGM